MPYDREVWAMPPCNYVKNAIKTVEGLLAEDREGYVLKNKAKNPFPMNYQLKLDVLNELGPELSSHYLQLIGIARWAIELGHINIHHEVSLLSQYQANPRVGHLEGLYHLFAYMKSHLDIGHVAFDPKTPWLTNQLLTMVQIGKSSMKRSKRNYHPRCQNRGDKG
jgi:hypothetical protein